MNPSIYHRILPIAVAPKALLATYTKEVVTHTAFGGVWVNRTPRQVIRTDVDGITPGDVCSAVIVKHAHSTVLIVIVSTSSPFGLIGILYVANKRQSTSPVLGGNTQKLDAFIDGNLPDDLNSASIFSKVIGHKRSNGSSSDLYSRFRINFENDLVQTQAPHFIDMGLPAINTFNESCVLGTPGTRIRRSMDGSHWLGPDYVFDESTAFGMIAEKSDHEYNYKTDFDIWRENQELERQNILTSQPPLDSAPIDTNTTNAKTSHLESTPAGTKTTDPKPLT